MIQFQHTTEYTLCPFMHTICSTKWPFLISLQKGETALIFAALNGSTKTVRDILSAGASADLAAKVSIDLIILLGLFCKLHYSLLNTALAACDCTWLCCLID